MDFAATSLYIIANTLKEKCFKLKDFVWADLLQTNITPLLGSILVPTCLGSHAQLQSI